MIPTEGDPQKAIGLPGLSSDGSHILMETPTAGPLRRLYMRVDQAVTYDVSRGAGVETGQHGRDAEPGRRRDRRGAGLGRACNRRGHARTDGAGGPQHCNNDGDRSEPGARATKPREHMHGIEPPSQLPRTLPAAERQ